MEFKQLQSFVAVVKYKSFTKAAEKLYIAQPTISAHIRQLEEELASRLVIRSTRSVEVTPRGWELYECAKNILELRDNLVQKWHDEEKQIIRIGASTIPSTYILPEILPKFGKQYPEVYFVVKQSDSQGVVEGLLQGNYDLGLTGMESDDEQLAFIPFYRDRMVLITPVNEHFLEIQQQNEFSWDDMLKEPIILRESGSGSKKAADVFLESLGISEKDLNISARLNDQESIKNLVAGGLGISVISEKAARNLEKEKRILVFDLPEQTAGRNLYLVYQKNYILRKQIEQFIDFVKNFYEGSGFENSIENT